MSDVQDPAKYFEVFNEIGIIEQLGRASLEAHLPDGLIAPHFNVLNHLTRLGDGRTPVAIANAFQVPKTSMTHTLKGLEQRRLVEIRPNPADGRSKQVFLTEAGRSLRNDVIQALGKDFQGLIAAFGGERLLSILPTLRDIRIYLDENRNTP